jgi:tRNA A37 N6-isopentenylltransferase MiaA
MSKLTDINRDSPTMFKQITVGTFTITQTQTFNINTELYSMDLKCHTYSILDFHLDVDDKIDTLKMQLANIQLTRISL